MAAPPPKASVKCANCGLIYQAGTKPPCPDGQGGPLGWSNEMLVFMRCTAGVPGKESKKK